MTTANQPKTDLLRTCPLCRGRIEPFKGPSDHTMGTCDDCGYSFVIPVTAWDVARQKAEKQRRG